MATSRTDTSRALVTRFRRRMLPIAIASGALVAATPPLVVGATEWQRARTTTTVHAEALATEIARDALRHPHIWRWRLPKTLDGVASRRGLAGASSIRVIGCDGQRLHARGEEEPERPPPVRARAPILARDRALGQVVLTQDAGPLWRRALMWAACSSLLGLLCGWLLFWFPVRVVRRQAHTLSHTQQELREANTSLQTRVDEATAELRQLSRRLLLVQDEERARIARDLHDDLAQQLSALRMGVDRARREAAEAPTRAALSEASSRCAEALDGLRRIIHDLRPLALEGESLEAALGIITERFEMRTGVATFLRCELDLQPPEHVAASALRVVREALHNVSRHARADEVGVALRATAGELTLRIHDDGAGFDPEAVASGHGLGNMRARAQLLDGAFTLEARAGEGTALTWRVRWELPPGGI